MSSVAASGAKRRGVTDHGFARAEERLKALRPRNPLWEGEAQRWLYRGHADAEWDLQPTRNPRPGGVPEGRCGARPGEPGTRAVVAASAAADRHASHVPQAPERLRRAGSHARPPRHLLRRGQRVRRRLAAIRGVTDPRARAALRAFDHDARLDGPRLGRSLLRRRGRRGDDQATGLPIVQPCRRRAGQPSPTFAESRVV